MKNLKVKVIVILALVMILQVILPSIGEVEAAIESGSNTLLISGGVTITKNTTPEQVISQYGADAKLITPSPFGGKAYTFYEGEYENILYMETDAENKIVSMGAISDDFQSQLISHGEITDQYVRYMSGTAIGDWSDNGATGVMVYNQDLMKSDRVNSFYQEYWKNLHEYQKYYCQHAIIITNHYLKEYNKSIMAEFNEEIFDVLSRIKKNGKSIDTYAEENKKSTFIQKMGSGVGVYTTYEMLPNPFEMANRTRGYSTTEDKKYAFFTFDVTDEPNGITDYTANIDTYYVSANFLKDLSETIELTDEEKEKLANAKAEYAKSVQTFNSDGSTNIYEVEPVYDTAPLNAGKVKENKLEGAIGYINAVRAGAGLPLFEHSNELSDYAQHKATLVVYNGIKGYDNGNPHMPTKPDEVSQEFYDKAQSGMSAENLYSGSYIIGTITEALNDVYGDPTTCGHRYNLLNPTLKYMGIGYIDVEGQLSGQGVHKFSGSQNTYKGNVVAWPSEGITPMEAYSGGRWTCMITSGYSITDDTTVNVVRLNDNREWNFSEESTGSSYFAINGGIITFSNSDFDAEDGYVYKITIKNLKNTETNQIEDYTYRSVFASVFGESTEVGYPTGVKLDKTNIGGIIGNKVELNTTILGENATEIILKWSSSNPSVATVNQYGTVTFVKPGTATIIVETLNGKKATCQVTVSNYLRGDLNQDGIVNGNDVNYGMRGIVGKITLTELEKQIGDVNDDGIFNANDINKIMRYIVGKVNTL